MGTDCCYENKDQKIISGIHLSEIEEEKNDSNDKSVNISQNNIIVFRLDSRFNHKKLFDDKEQNIKNKSTMKRYNKRINLINKYKYKEDKFEKFIKFTHFNKIVSSTTNSLIKQ